jgi:flavin-dependent dehydrogenase
MWDVVISGAGPSGAVSAYVMASAGRRVLLLDPHPFPTCKVGEALPGAALRLLRTLALPLPDKNGPHVAIRGSLTSWNSDDLLPYDFLRDPDGNGWRLDRPYFDSQLRQHALQSGASLLPAQIKTITRCDKVWRLSLSNGEIISTRWLVDATGRVALVTRKLGIKRVVESHLTAVYAFGHTSKLLQLDRTLIEAVPQGWWYAAALPSAALVAGLHMHPRDAATLVKDHSQWLQALTQTRHVARNFLDVTFDSRLHILDASGSRLQEFAGDQWVACGDAAVSFDPLSGQGLYSAIHGGMTAGQSVNRALDGTARSVLAYTQRVEQVWQIYSQRLRETYRSETRWPTHRFWATAARTPVASCSPSWGLE